MGDDGEDGEIDYDAMIDVLAEELVIETNRRLRMRNAAIHYRRKYQEVKRLLANASYRHEKRASEGAYAAFKLNEENKRLRAALERYADPDSWDQSHTMPLSVSEDWWLGAGNGYDLAQKALHDLDKEPRP